MKNEEKLTLAFIESSPVEAARVMEKLSVGDVAAYLEEIPARFGGLAVHPLVPDFAGQCLREMSEEKAAALIQHLDAHKAAVLLRLLSPAKADALLDELPRSAARPIQKLLQYPPHTVGAWMEALLPVVPETATVKEALRTAKKLGPQLTDSLFVIDPNDRVAGKIPLTRLVVARGSLRVSDLMEAGLTLLSDQATLWSAKTGADWAECRMHPVADRDGRLVGLLFYPDLLKGLAQPAGPGRAPGGRFHRNIKKVWAKSFSGVVRFFRRIPFISRKPVWKDKEHDR